MRIPLSSLTLLGLIFIVLKVAGIITWSWWLVLAPLWIGWALFVILALLFFGTMLAIFFLAILLAILEG